MIVERLWRNLKKKEPFTIEPDQTVDDLLQQFYGNSLPLPAAEEQEPVDTFLSRAQAGIEFQAVLAQSLSAISIGGQSFVSLFSHGGAFCTHCVATVGSSVGGLSGIGLPGIGGGHWHDGVWHESDHDDEKKPNVSSTHHQRHTPKPATATKQVPKTLKRAESRTRRTITISDFVTTCFTAQACT